MKVKKSTNSFFKYEYKGVYINKSITGEWFVHASDKDIKIDKGLSNKVLGKLIVMIDQSIERNKKAS